MDLSIPYYEDKTRISNSNIGWFLNKGPAYLHKMLTEDVPEEKNSILARGTMIHEYLLQPEEFQKDYVVWSKSRPYSAQQEKFCQALVNTIEIEPNKAIISAYKEAYSTAGKSEDKMLSEGLKIASNLKEYIDFLKAKDNRIIISNYDMQMLANIKTNIQSHKLACSLVCGVHETENTAVYHEFHINWETKIIERTGEKRNPVKCKSLLDILMVDFKSKTIVIGDLKTTSKLWEFEKSMETYDYHRQIAYYFHAVIWWLENEKNIPSKDIDINWKFKYYIIAIDTTSSHEVRVFELSYNNIENASVRIYDALVDISWHIETNNWDHSRQYYEGDGSEQLKV